MRRDQERAERERQRKDRVRKPDQPEKTNHRPRRLPLAAKLSILRAHLKT
jgi:hypothetical protein